MVKDRWEKLLESQNTMKDCALIDWVMDDTGKKWRKTEFDKFYRLPKQNVCDENIRTFPWQQLDFRLP